MVKSMKDGEKKVVSGNNPLHFKFSNCYLLSETLTGTKTIPFISKDYNVF